MSLVYSLPLCYFEFVTVKLDISKWKIYRELRKDYNYGLIANPEEVFTHESGFCGVRNMFHLYPEVLDLEIIYVSKAVESASEFSVTFQVMDSNLLKTVKTSFSFVLDYTVHIEQILLINNYFKVLTLHIKVNKLSKIDLQTLTNDSFTIYDGPVITEIYKLKTFSTFVKLSSFQCTIIIGRNSTFYIKYRAAEIALTKSMYLAQNKSYYDILPVKKCRYQHGQHCLVKVGKPIKIHDIKFCQNILPLVALIYSSSER